jgi:superfamily I DNA/RNA helicase
VDYSDIAILYRKHNDSEELIDALLKHGIPINISAGSNALLKTL